MQIKFELSAKGRKNYLLGGIELPAKQSIGVDFGSLKEEERKRLN